MFIAITDAISTVVRNIKMLFGTFRFDETYFVFKANDSF
jgi:hypothetical protein